MPELPNALPKRVSLVIAISGHRDLDRADHPALQRKIEQFFARVRTDYELNETSLLLITALAEGADRVAAKAAIAAGVLFVAVLPMSFDLYRTDFESEAADAEFIELIGQAARVIQLPNHKGITDDDLRPPRAPARDLQYHDLARFLVHYSQILLAIYDGASAPKQGGTAHTIQLNLGELTGFEDESDFDTRRVGTGPVYTIYARRLSSSRVTGPVEEITLTFPRKTEPVSGKPVKPKDTSYGRGYTQMERFNRDIAKGGDLLKEAAEKSKGGLLADHQVANLSEAMKWVAHVYSYADALAEDFNRWSLWRWRLAYLLLAIGGAGLALAHSHLFDSVPLHVYYPCIAIFGVIVLWERLGQLRERHEDYRALAEALRVQFFWMAAGLPRFAADHYQTQQSGELSWIRDAISECALYEDLLHPPAVPNVQSYGIAQIWIRGQIEFFQNKGQSCGRYRKVFHYTAVILAVLAFVSPVVTLLPETCNIPEKTKELALAGAAISGWLAAICWGYVEARGWSQLERQYSRMLRVFTTADIEIEKYRKEGRLDLCRAALFELGCEALTENADWLAMHRERKLSFSSGA